MHFEYIDEFVPMNCFSGSERRRQPEQNQTCYENHNAVQIKSACLGLAFQTIRGKIVDSLHSRG